MEVYHGDTILFYFMEGINGATSRSWLPHVAASGSYIIELHQGSISWTYSFFMDGDEGAMSLSYAFELLYRTNSWIYIM